MCFKNVFMFLIMFSTLYGSVESTSDANKDQNKLKLTKTYLDIDHRLCVHATWRSHTRTFECEMPDTDYLFKTRFPNRVQNMRETNFSICSKRVLGVMSPGNMLLKCHADNEFESTSVPIYIQDLEPKILYRSFSYDINRTPVHTITLKSNPFYLVWEFNNKTLLAGQSDQGVTALEQELIGNFTYNVSLQFTHWQKEYLHYYYKLVLNFGPPTKSFHILFDLKDRNNSHFRNDIIRATHRARKDKQTKTTNDFSTSTTTLTKASKVFRSTITSTQAPTVATGSKSTTQSSNPLIKQCNNESVSECNDFQTSTFLSGLAAGLLAAGALLLLRRLAARRPPRARMPTPPPEPEYYSEVYSWRRPR